ncbi:electron transport complex subunit E [Aquisalimonas asiatica]|uniref:Ion-translocating oxidoreductase complex subunit E n=1 Tax=Aquisalimonas asiatica TaxID=406100 RepID=A0A1H8RMU0_9GAMM|nr:electron transport complex subunit E [Aquisalimonas asiatica]SEO67607.1 electron transport complex protein RnfE [Aquisalimonas asiatica]
MAATDFAELARNGLWHNNPGLVQLLGLCPLLAVSNTTVNALALGLATTLVLTGSNVTVSMIRNAARPEIRIPVFVLIIASFVTVVELVMNAFFHQLYLILGIFIPLIVTNCAILGRAEAFASRTTPAPAAFDGLMMGLGFTGVLVALGGLRELLGHGGLLRDAHLLFGDAGRHLTLQLVPVDQGFLLALLPPGAFIGLGLLLALKNVIDSRARRPVPTTQTEPLTTP